MLYKSQAKKLGKKQQQMKLLKSQDNSKEMVVITTADNHA
jgi:hypothetical protein